MVNFFTGKDNQIRQTRFAGSWYTASPGLLQEQIQTFRAKASEAIANPSPSLKTLAIISPHAGYRYSGQTAAFAFRSAENTKPSRVILLGPSHYKALHGIALPAAKGFATPFGTLPLDTGAIDELAAFDGFTARQDIHDVEHSLEMQLPFIYQELGELPIIPLVVGRFHDLSELANAGRALRSVIKDGDIVIVSSDFTHYGPNYDYVPFADPDGTRVKALDRQAFVHIKNKDVEGFVHFEQETGATICGFYPIALLLAVLPPVAEGQLLYHTTSREVYPEVGTNLNSVGYMAIEFRAPGWHVLPDDYGKSAGAIQFSEKEGSALLALARASLIACVNDLPLPSPQDLAISITPGMEQKLATFVTLYKLPYQGAGAELKELRGCIGNIYPRSSLWESVCANTQAAALKDPRFLPVKQEELPLLRLEINILDLPQEIDSWQNIVLGEMGIILIKNNRQAVFLPHVATEFGWTLEETLTQLALKAGLKPDDWRSGTTFLVFGARTIEEKYAGLS